jgi:hypothetical protein
VSSIELVTTGSPTTVPLGSNARRENRCWPPHRARQPARVRWSHRQAHGMRSRLRYPQDCDRRACQHREPRERTTKEPMKMPTETTLNRAHNEYEVQVVFSDGVSTYVIQSYVVGGEGEPDLDHDSAMEIARRTSPRQCLSA